MDGNGTYVTDFNDEFAPKEELIESDDEKDEEKPAGFWLRLVAYIIDVIIIGSINGILLSPLLFVNEGTPIEISFWTLNGIISIIVYYAYFLILTKTFQQTLGKMIVGIKVVGEENENLTWADLFFREVVGRIIHNVFFILKLLYLTIVFTNKKQGIHDMIANTRVVHI